jgi:hypothetical protein
MIMKYTVIVIADKIIIICRHVVVVLALLPCRVGVHDDYYTIFAFLLFQRPVSFRDERTTCASKVKLIQRTPKYYWRQRTLLGENHNNENGFARAFGGMVVPTCVAGGRRHGSPLVSPGAEDSSLFYFWREESVRLCYFLVDGR